MIATSETSDYDVRRLDGETVELCSRCGFDGRRYPPGAVVDALGALKCQWLEILGGDDAIIRTRPSDDTWCAVEYAAHTRDIIAGLTFVAGLFLDEDSPELPAMQAPPEEGVGVDECNRFAPGVLAHELGTNVDELAELIAGLTPEGLRRPGSIGEIDGDVLGIARHAVHDATHHVLDARCGMAAVLLREVSQ